MAYDPSASYGGSAPASPTVAPGGAPTDPYAPFVGSQGNTAAQDVLGADTTIQVRPDQARLPLLLQGSLKSVPGGDTSGPTPADAVGAVLNAFNAFGGGGIQQSGDSNAPGTPGGDAARGGSSATGSTNQTTVAEALTRFKEFNPDQVKAISDELYAAGYFSSKFYGSTKTPTTPTDVYEAYKKAVLDAATTGTALPDMISQRTDQFKALHPDLIAGVNSVGRNIPSIIERGGRYNINLTNPDDVNMVADAVGQKLIGRNLTDSEKATVLSTIQTQEQTKGSADVAAAEGGRQEQFQARVDARNEQFAGQMGGGTGAPGTGILDTALGLQGTKYVYGGTDPSTGVDCSGFTQYVFKQAGLDIGRDTSAQRQAPGTDVGSSVQDLHNAQPGDLLFFGDKAGENAHVGIYMGNGKMIDAPNSQSVVRIDDVASWDASGEKLNQIKRVAGSENVIGGSSISGGQPRIPAVQAAPTDPAAIDSFMQAIKQQESSGNYDPNLKSPDGNWGAYQFSDDRWNADTRALGLDPNNKSPQQQDQVARWDMAQQFQTTGDWGAVAAQWYGGDGGLQAYQAGRSDASAPQAGNFPAINSYVQQVMQKMGASNFTPTGTTPTDAYIPPSIATTTNPDSPQAASDAYVKQNDAPEYHAHQLVDAYNQFQQALQAKAQDGSAARPMTKA